MTPLQRFDEVLGRRVSMRALALLRILMGPVVLLHLQPILGDARRGILYRDHFHEPYASWYPELPRGLYVAVLWLAAVAAVALCFGVATRLAAGTCFAVVTYDMFLSTTNFHNNRAYLIVVLAALVVAPSGRELSFDAWRRRRRGQPLDTTSPAWPLWLLRFEASVVYGASGLSKLLDRDWWGGTVTYLRVVADLDQLRASPVPSPIVDLLARRSFHTGAAKVVILTELFIALGLWSQRTRYAAVWVAVVFHVSIQLSASVEVFSVLAISVLVVWAVPRTRDRTLHLDPARHRALLLAVRRLDWLARFRVVADGGPVRVVDRDGSERQGTAAVVFALSRLPLTAWPTLPLLLIAPRPHAGRVAQ